MSNENEIKAIRAGSQIARVYNDGLVVYVYDESARESLLKEDVLDIMGRALDEKTPAGDKAVKVFGKDARLVVYELWQDDSVRLEVAVGAPPEKKELAVVKGLKWLKPQVSRLNVPSGKLCVESPNSCRIDTNDDAQEPGAVLTVPPGDYVVTLCRVDLAGNLDEVMEKYHGPQEFMTLTPVDPAQPPKPAPWALPVPAPKKPSTKWVGKFAVEGRTFTCLVNFWDYWELIQTNLDRAAARQLGLAMGSVLRIQCDAGEFKIAMLGDGIQFSIPALGGYKMLASNDPATAELMRENPEVALGVFRQSEISKTELLNGLRAKASAAVDQKFHGKWIKASGEVLATGLNLLAAEDFGAWTFHDGVLRGKALFRGDRYLTVNFQKAALAKLELKTGDRLLLGVNGKENALTYFADAKSMHAAGEKASRPTGEKGEAFQELWDKQARSPDSEKMIWAEKMRSLVTLDPAISAAPDKHWYWNDQDILLVQPSVRDRQVLGLVFLLNLDVKAGDAIALRKAPVQ